MRVGISVFRVRFSACGRSPFSGILFLSMSVEELRVETWVVRGVRSRIWIFVLDLKFSERIGASHIP